MRQLPGVKPESGSFGHYLATLKQAYQVDSASFIELLCSMLGERLDGARLTDFFTQSRRII